MSEESFFDAYVTAALWSSNDESRDDGGDPLDENYSAGDISLATLEAMRVDCDKFQTDNAAALESAGLTEAQAGHDFWLTRNGHGCGFWDGDWPEPQATQLTSAAETFGEFNLLIADNGLISHSAG